MVLKLAINGYGRIGRTILRALYENYMNEDVKIVAINCSDSAHNIAHTTKYDTTHGKFFAKVGIEGKNLTVNNDLIQLLQERDPRKLPWADLDIDIVLDCTGKFKQRKTAAWHLDSGARKVLISSPAQDKVDATIVYGVNHNTLTANDVIISNASCTTNCLAPIAHVFLRTLGIEFGTINTIHAYTNDQTLIDSKHKDLRRARSATQSIIPTSTGAAKSVELIMPELTGKLSGFATRVPTLNVSLVDFSFTTKYKNLTVTHVNELMLQAINSYMQGIVLYNDAPLVSCDFNHEPASAIFDASLTQVTGNLVKVVAWYDNEWGFANRMLDTALFMQKFSN